MTKENLIELIKKIVSDANELKNKFTNEIKAPVNYACVFSQNQAEYTNLIEPAGKLGWLIKEIPNGLLFALEQFDTTSGTLPLLKIRQLDSTRPERGDADFTVSDYQSFKEMYLGQPGFKLIKRPEMEMIELMQPGYDVRAYFSHPTLLEVLKAEQGN